MIKSILIKTNLYHRDIHIDKMELYNHNKYIEDQKQKELENSIKAYLEVVEENKKLKNEIQSLKIKLKMIKKELNEAYEHIYEIC